MATQFKNLPLILLILDGWGIAPPSRGNAFTGADTPFYNDLLRNYQTFAVAASGEAVGLPWGEPGNSEVGHLNLGAGKIVYQPVLKINRSIENKSFFENETLLGAVKHCQKNNSSLHLMGILSDGGVHGHIDHLYALLELAARNNLTKVFVHGFLDGRDTPFASGLDYVSQLEKVFASLGAGKLVSLSGRFWGMDRDNHWERTEKAYRTILGQSEQIFVSAREAVAASYGRKVFDEEFAPCLIKSDNETQKISSGDAVIFFNYRPDRARQLTRALGDANFDKFPRKEIADLYFATLTEYDPQLPVKVAFRQDLVENPIAKAWSDAGLKQLHLAETEKYAHVTYFFNGGQDIVFPGQENQIIPSAGVPSYADKPEMSVFEIKDKAIEMLKKSIFDCFVVNFANADMVGHTGNIAATRQALADVDKAIKELAGLAAKLNGVLVITADHGNAEEKVDWETGGIVKEHSRNPVPCTLVGSQFRLGEPRPDNFYLDQLSVAGVLSDVTPTLLSICGLTIPGSMTSRSLI